MGTCVMTERRKTILQAAALLRRAAALLESIDPNAVPTTDPPRLYGLRQRILQILREKLTLTTPEIVNALYEPQYGIDRDTFKRRVIVTLSSMHRADKSICRGYGHGELTPLWKISDPVVISDGLTRSTH